MFSIQLHKTLMDRFEESVHQTHVVMLYAGKPFARLELHWWEHFDDLPLPTRAVFSLPLIDTWEKISSSRRLSHLGHGYWLEVYEEECGVHNIYLLHKNREGKWMKAPFSTSTGKLGARCELKWIPAILAMFSQEKGK